MVQGQGYMIDASKLASQVLSTFEGNQRCVWSGVVWWKMTPFVLINSGRFLSISWRTEVMTVHVRVAKLNSCFSRLSPHSQLIFQFNSINLQFNAKKAYLSLMCLLLGVFPVQILYDISQYRLTQLGKTYQFFFYNPPILHAIFLNLRSW